MEVPRSRRRLAALIMFVSVMASLLTSAVSVAAQAAPSGTPTLPHGVPLSHAAIMTLAAEFNDNPVTGGQVMPRIAKFVNDNAFIFLQFDKPKPADATEFRYIGIGVKGVFCKEDQPDRSFTHFHRYSAPEYKLGHGGPPGAQGYWLTWVAVDTFDATDGRHITPGVDYAFSPTPPPSCGANVPKPNFNPPAAHKLSPVEIQKLAALFSDPVLTGGQVPPRFSKWVNPDVFMFVQFDKPKPTDATAVRYFGIGVRGTFCKEAQASTDFPHYHRINAPEYKLGHGGKPGETAGYWLLWVATDSFTASDGRQVNPGVDRAFSPTPAPVCGGAPAASPAAQSATHQLSVTATEWRFDPAELRVQAGEHVTIVVTNAGTVLHTFTIPALGVDTGAIQPGAKATVTFMAPTAPTTAEFLCTMPEHAEAGMIGKLVVT